MQNGPFLSMPSTVNVSCVWKILVIVNFTSIYIVCQIHSNNCRNGRVVSGTIKKIYGCRYRETAAEPDPGHVQRRQRCGWLQRSPGGARQVAVQRDLEDLRQDQSGYYLQVNDSARLFMSHNRKLLVASDSWPASPRDLAPISSRRLQPVRGTARDNGNWSNKQMMSLLLGCELYVEIRGDSK